jgi:guanine nucleotide exchange factor
MSTHVPNGPSVCIHSVCVSPLHRRKGIALRLLINYVERLRCSTTYERVLLITHEELRALYEAAGFEFVGASAVQHGAKPWYEMRKILRNSSQLAVGDALGSTAPSSVDQADILAALMQQASSARTRPPPALLRSFQNGLDNVCTTVESNLTNTYALVCPRPGCGSTILLARTANLVDKQSIQVWLQHLASCFSSSHTH